MKADWVTCPYCSVAIGPPASNTIGLQESVVMGNVAINDASSISDAMQIASKCISCGSTGTTQITCSSCDQMAYCSICKDETHEERLETYVTDYRRKHYSRSEKLGNKRLCSKCHSKQQEEEFHRCPMCSKFHVYSINECFRCGKKACTKCESMTSVNDSYIYSEKCEDLGIKLKKGESVSFCSHHYTIKDGWFRDSYAWRD